MATRCPKGHSNADGMKFCGECGAPLAPVAAESPRRPDDLPVPPAPSSGRRSSSRTGLIIPATIAAIVLVGGGLAVGLSLGKDDGADVAAGSSSPTAVSPAPPSASPTVIEETATPTVPVPEEDPTSPADFIEIAGNASPRLSEATGGEVSVVALGPYDRLSGIVPIIVQNGTGTPVADITIAGSARNGGKLIASGQDQGISPSYVPPDDYSFGYVYFASDLNITGETEFEFDVEWSNGASDFVDIAVTEAEGTPNGVVGSAQNTTDRKVSGPIGISVMCFDTNGRVLSAPIGFLNKDTLLPGETGTWQVDLYSDPCPRFWVAASGFKF